MKYLQKSASQGKINACSVLGFMYFQGEGIAKDEKRGIYWLRKAAEKGEPTAQFDIGCAYMDGTGGLVQNTNEALKWLKASASQGNTKAQIRINEIMNKR